MNKKALVFSTLIIDRLRSIDMYLSIPGQLFMITRLITMIHKSSWTRVDLKLLKYISLVCREWYFFRRMSNCLKQLTGCQLLPAALMSSALRTGEQQQQQSDSSLSGLERKDFLN